MSPCRGEHHTYLKFHHVENQLWLPSKQLVVIGSMTFIAKTSHICLHRSTYQVGCFGFSHMQRCVHCRMCKWWRRRKKEEGRRKRRRKSSTTTATTTTTMLLVLVCVLSLISTRQKFFKKYKHHGRTLLTPNRNLTYNRHYFVDILFRQK